MKRHSKKQCLDITGSLQNVHVEISKIIGNNDAATACKLLEQCQNLAIKTGSIIETSEGEGTEAVACLENYCELLYQISQEIAAGSVTNPAKIEKVLNKSILRAGNFISALPEKTEAVFLPYNAAMWDSLESIWIAAAEDPDCETYVVPIPYYDRNPGGSFGQLHYEGDRFPDYVPITDFREFDLKTRHPDMIYIHNPYDEYNYVTSVHPDYYSTKLINYTDCLVYVPYYATSGGMDEAQAILPSYMVVDHIVVQSKELIEHFDKRVPKEKFLPLGSPKYDRVIRLCNDPPSPPDEWKEKMAGKRVYFYNTSIGGMVEDTDKWLKKLRYVFDTFKETEDACILWRPHPLLLSSLESMRPEYLNRYNELIEYFINEDIGILDRTPDIEASMALSDAYIGDAGTSVTSLFGVAGKPVYVLNNTYLEKPAEDDWKAGLSGAVRSDRYDQYFLAMGNRIFEKKYLENTYHYLCDLPNDYSGGGYYYSIIKEAGKVMIFPVNAENILIMEEESHEFRKIDIRHEVGRMGAFAGATNLIFSDHPEIFYLLPNRYPSLVRFDAISEKVSYIEDEAFSDEYSVCTNELKERIIAVRFFRYDKGLIPAVDETKGIPGLAGNTQKTVTAPDGTEHAMYEITFPEIPGITLKGPKLLCFDVSGKRMRAVQLETGRVQEREVHLDGLYTGVLEDINELGVLWFLPYIGTTLVKWNTANDTWEKVDAGIDGLISLRRPQRTVTRDYYFSNGIFHDGKLILAPNRANKFVEIDTVTNEAKEWIPPFPFTTDDKSSYFKNYSIGYFYGDAFDFSLKFYYAPEQIIYDLDLTNNTATPNQFEFDKEEVMGLSMGFHRESQWLPYCCFEDMFNPLGDFIRDEVHGPRFEKEKQFEAYKSINASPEGDCGKKVHEAVLKTLHGLR